MALNADSPKRYVLTVVTVFTNEAVAKDVFEKAKQMRGDDRLIPVSTSRYVRLVETDVATAEAALRGREPPRGTHRSPN